MAFCGANGVDCAIKLKNPFVYYFDTFMIS
jgi:hypothetical protein